MHSDFDDTVIAPARAPRERKSVDFDDTIIRSADTSGITTGPREQPTLILPPETRSAPDRDVAQVYAFRIGRNPSVVLDVPTYIGRRPSTPRVITGEVPRLVRVASPNGEVSATHVELRQLGSTVVITDLRSTNGTVVGIPGQLPRTLRQGESAVVTPGTLVDIGDNNVIEILPLQDVQEIG